MNTMLPCTCKEKSIVPSGAKDTTCDSCVLCLTRNHSFERRLYKRVNSVPDGEVPVHFDSEEAEAYHIVDDHGNSSGSDDGIQHTVSEDSLGFLVFVNKMNDAAKVCLFRYILPHERVSKHLFISQRTITDHSSIAPPNHFLNGFQATCPRAKDDISPQTNLRKPWALVSTLLQPVQQVHSCLIGPTLMIAHLGFRLSAEPGYEQ